MNQFKDLGIEPIENSFVGEKISPDFVLNREITVWDFKIKDSKYATTSGKCLHMQIEIDGNKRVLFTGSGNLMDLIIRIQKDKFPFKTTIVKENKRFIFT
jgi:hypothetical protein